MKNGIVSVPNIHLLWLLRVFQGLVLHLLMPARVWRFAEDMGLTEGDLAKISVRLDAAASGKHHEAPGLYQTSATCRAKVAQSSGWMAQAR